MDEVHFTLTTADFWRLQRRVLLRRLRSRFPFALILFLIGVGAMLLLVLPSLPSMYIPLAVLLILAFFLLLFVLLFALSFLIARLIASRAGSSLRNRGVHVVEINEQGLRQKHELGEGLTAWRAFKAIDEDRQSFYLQVDNPGSAIVMVIIPKRAFESPSQAERFIERARGYWREHTSHPS